MIRRRLEKLRVSAKHHEILEKNKRNTKRLHSDTLWAWHSHSGSKMSQKLLLVLQDHGPGAGLLSNNRSSAL